MLAVQIVLPKLNLTIETMRELDFETITVAVSPPKHNSFPAGLSRPYTSELLGWKKFHSTEEVVEFVREWVYPKQPGFFSRGIRKIRGW